MESPGTNSTTCPDFAGFVSLQTHKIPTQKNQMGNFLLKLELTKL